MKKLRSIVDYCSFWIFRPKCIDKIHGPLERYLEVLPDWYRPSYDAILAQQREDGSLFQSPSATASALMITGNDKFIDYLQSLVIRCDKVPARYPVNQDFIKLCMVDHLRRSGCGDHFREEVGEFMDKIYWNWCMQPQLSSLSNECDVSDQISKDSLAFQLLRAHGYPVSPGRLCWFMDDKEILAHIEKNYFEFLGTMHLLYRATHFAFPEEIDLQKAGIFSRNILKKFLSSSTFKSGNCSQGLTALEEEITRELDIPWLARMDHLEHRIYIERNKGYYLGTGKNSYCRIASSKWIHQLAVETFSQRQLVYKEELLKLTRWSKEQGLSSIGFGRENTMYCYFCASTSVSLPLQSDLRMVVAKCATLVTVADDFFDEKGSIEELEKLTDAVRRWEGAELSGHSKVIFQALVELVHDVAVEYHRQYGLDIIQIFQRMWSDSFDAWLEESKWSKIRATPSTNEYLRVAKISIAIQAMTLPACFLASPDFPGDASSGFNYSSITELIMVLARLMNDCQSYQKELENGKLNMVILHMKENPKASIEASIEHIRKIIEIKDKEFLELYFSDDRVSNAWKILHLGTLKTFHMLFDSSNLFDSTTALLCDINMAFNTPLGVKPETNILPELKPSYKAITTGSSFDQCWGNNNGYLRKDKGQSERINCSFSRATNYTSKQLIKCQKSTRWPISLRPPPNMFYRQTNSAMPMRMLL